MLENEITENEALSIARVSKSVCKHIYKNEKQNGWGKFICILCKKYL